VNMCSYGKSKKREMRLINVVIIVTLCNLGEEVGEGVRFDDKSEEITSVLPPHTLN